MTIHLLPTSRRTFLRAATVGGITAVSSVVSAADRKSATCLALLADTHIAGNKAAKGLGGTVMYDNLSRVVDEILSQDPLPAGAIVNGDCAHLLGFEQDYQTLRQLLQRLVDQGVPVHLTMGNHDNRGPFYRSLADQQRHANLVEGKHVSVIDLGPVNLFLVDSLQRVNGTPGEIGSKQLRWLDQSLQNQDGKPALVFGHHHPQIDGGNISGLQDTEAFLATLHSHPHVQAYFFGHTHNWHLAKTEQGLDLINQPPVAYVFDQSRPNGWVRMTVTEDATTLQLNALDPEHPQHLETHRLLHRIPLPG